jgi:Leucine-rich repeat (LRR) protein
MLGLKVSGLTLVAWSLLATLAHVYSADIENCPSSCSCFIKVSTKGILVNCTSRDLHSVPGLFPINAEELILSENDFKTIDTSSFPILPKLQRLVINHTPLINLVAEDSDVKFPHLEVLDLSHNDLALVPLNLPRSLRVIHLSYNRIFELKGSTFSHLKKLKELYLDHNQLRKITEESFHGLTKDEVTLANLDKLSLKKNRIQSISPKAFENLISLSALNLARNKLSVLKMDTFHRLLDLEHLDLHGNRLSEIEDETFYMLKGLRFLSLKNNLLPSVPHGIPMLEWLDLSHNKIRNISSTQRTDIYPSELFILSHNPLHCDCNLLWLKEIFDRREYLHKHTDLKVADFYPSCASPSRVAGESWEHLGDETFVCLPEDALEVYEESDVPVELTLRHGRITDHSMEIQWSIKGRPKYESVFLQYYVFGKRSSGMKYIEINLNQREYTLKALQSDSNYIVCIIPKLDDSEEYSIEKMRPLSYDHCLELSTLPSNVLLENVSYLAVAGYYVLGMMGTIIALFSCIGGLALIYGVWTAKCSDWSAKYAIDAPMPDLDLHNKLSKEENEGAEPETKSDEDKKNL